MRSYLRTHFGAQALPLMGSGDWNDGMDRVGPQCRGQSVWLAWFMVDVLKGMAELSDLLGRPDLSRSYYQDREAWIAPVMLGWWDGFQMSYRHGEAIYKIHVENPSPEPSGWRCKSSSETGQPIQLWLDRSSGSGLASEH